MHILLVADGRSNITRGWLRMLRGLDCRVFLVSTFPCEPPEGADLVGVLPVGFSSLAGRQVKLPDNPESKPQKTTDWQRRMISAFRPVLLTARAWLAPMTLRKYQAHFVRLVNDLKPDLVHALRIPFEGMLASDTPENIPFLVSIWGNDLTLHANASPLMGRHTQQVLRRADGLLADAHRDIRLARQMGLRENMPTLVVPGNGGLELRRIQETLQKKDFPCHSERSEESRFDLPSDRMLVINPRGFRPGSVHQDTFFKSIPLVLEKIPETFFICTAMLGQAEAEKWVKKLGIRDHILLLPYLPQEELWYLYSHSQVYVSLSSHDGTPNTFLEALACGCFPVVGNIESLREWLQDGKNGLLVDPRDHHQAAHAVIEALTNRELTEKAKKLNKELISERAETGKVRDLIEGFLSRFQ